jgi:hypothetical protein
VTDSLVRFFGEQCPAHTGLKEEELIDRIAGSVVARLGSVPKSQAKGEQRYVRKKEVAAFLGVSLSALRSWRSKRSSSGPSVTRIDRMVLYLMKGLERFMEQRTGAAVNSSSTSLIFVCTLLLRLCIA